MDIVVDKKNPDTVADKPESVAPFFENLLRVIAPEQVNNPPIGSLLKNYHRLPGEWIAITPIHWRVTHNDSMIEAYGADLKLNEALAKAYLKQFSHFWRGENRLFYHSPDLWLLRVDGDPALNSITPAAAFHKSLMPIISEWDASMHWQRLFTEIQMFCAAPKFEHYTTDALPLNGLWFWGAGEIRPGARKLFTNDTALADALNSSLSTALLDNQNASQLPPDSIIALIAGDSGWIERLSTRRKAKFCHWYWNNAHIKPKPRPWWQRLWSPNR